MKGRDHSHSMKDCQTSRKRVVDKLLRKVIPVSVFAAAALTGPLIRYVAWPPSKIGQIGSFRLDVFIYDLVFLLWPTQMLAVIEASLGSFVAAAVAVGANVVLYGAIGMLVGVTAGRRSAVLVLYLFVSTLVTLFALWGAGFGLAHLNVPALGIALILYAVPFWLVRKLAY
jgi:hypothetical protein